MLIDISHWNGVFDWSRAQAQGVIGAYLKASQGTYITDDMFEINGSSCPLPYRGAYHFLDYTTLHYVLGNEIDFGKRQAEWFIKVMGIWKHNLPGAIDVEKNGKWPDAFDISRVLKIALAFKNRFIEIAGHSPAFYCSSFLTDYLTNFLDCPLWVANYNDIPVPEIGVFDKYAIWQHTSTADGQLYGNAPDNLSIDLNKEGVPVKDWALGPEMIPEPEGNVLFQAKVIITKLNVRNAPNKTALDVGDVYFGDIRNVYDAYGDWLCIGTDKWICEKEGAAIYIQRLPINNPPPVPVVKKWYEMTTDERLELLKSKHPEIV